MIGFYELIALSLAGLTFLMMIVYIYCSYKKSANVQLVIKSATSVCFLFTGIMCAGTVAVHIQTASFLVIGMFFSVTGDVILSLKNMKMRFYNRLMGAGMLAFVFAHASYIIAFFGLLPLSIPMLSLGIGLAGLFISICLKAKLNFKNLYFQVMFFSIVISMMFAQTVFMAMFLDDYIYKYLILTGAILFVISNVGIGLKYFKEEKLPFLNGVNVSFYYIAQLLFAISMLFIA